MSTKIPRECILSLSNIEEIPQISPWEENFMREEQASPSYPEELAEEWMNNSLTLMADACYVRNLMILGFRGMQENYERNNEIRDAVFIRCKNREDQISLKVILGWMRIVHRSRIERSRSQVVEWSRGRRLNLYYFRKWDSYFHATRMTHAKLHNTLRQTLSSWGDYCSYFTSRRRKLEVLSQRHMFSRSIHGWHNAYADMYLLGLKREEEFRKALLLRGLQFLIKNRAEGVKKSTLSQLREGGLIQNIFQTWLSEVRTDLSIRSHFYDNTKNRLGPYLLYKLLVGGRESVEVNPSIRQQTEKHLHNSILHAVLCKWQNFTCHQLAAQKRKEFTIRSDWFYAWVEYVRKHRSKMHKVDRFRESIQLHRSKELLKQYWELWVKREGQRNIFRSHLASLVHRSSLFTQSLCFSGWTGISRKGSKLNKKLKFLQARKTKKIFQNFMSAGRDWLRDKALRELVDIVQRKGAFRVVVAVMRAGVDAGKRKSELEKKGDFLTMAVCFSRWTQARRMRRCVVSFVRSVDVVRARTCMHAFFETWKKLWKLKLLQNKNSLIQSRSSSRDILSIFAANVRLNKRKRIIAAQVQICRRRTALNLLRKHADSRTCFMKYFTRRKIFFSWEKWVRARLWAESFRVLSRLHAKVLLNQGMHALLRHCEMNRAGEFQKAESIIIARVAKVVREWNLLAKFHQVSSRWRSGVHSGYSGKERPIQLSKWWDRWTRILEVARTLRQKKYLRETSIKRLVFARSSPWRVAAHERHLARRINNCSVTNVWETWWALFGDIQSRMYSLLEREQGWRSDRAKKIIQQWYLFVANQRLMKASLFAAWRGFVSRSVAVRNGFVRAFSLKASNQIHEAWETWKLRYSQRESLREKILEMTLNHVRRRAMYVLLGFAKERDLGLKFRVMRDRRGKKSVNMLLDKWIKGAVTVISIRELLGGGKIEKFRSKTRLSAGFSEWKTFARIARFEEHRKLRMQQVAEGKDCEIRAKYFSEWQAFVSEESVFREKIELMKKFYAIQRFRRYYETKSEKLTMEALADELALQFQTDRIADCIERAVIGWKDWVEGEKVLKDKFVLIQAVHETRIVAASFTEWKYQWEMAVYEGEILAHEADVVAKINFKTKTKVFNQLILMFLEGTEVVKLGIEFHHFMLKRRVLSGLKNNQSIEKKSHELADLILKKNLRKSIQAMRTESVLTRNERLYFSKHNSRHALTQLRIFAKFKRDTNSNMNTPRTPYHQQRKQSLKTDSPVVTPPPSYRDRRQQKKREQRV